MELVLVICLRTVATLGANGAQIVETVRKLFGGVRKLGMSGWSRRTLDFESFE